MDNPHPEAVNDVRPDEPDARRRRDAGVPVGHRQDDRSGDAEPPGAPVPPDRQRPETPHDAEE
jgi:hypothetical protein